MNLILCVLDDYPNRATDAESGAGAAANDDWSQQHAGVWAHLRSKA